MRIRVPLAHKKRGGQAAQALGRSRGGFSCKIHVTVDALGNPLRFRLTGGQRNDITQAPDLLVGLTFGHLLGDRGYDADSLIALVTEQGAELVIPSSKARRQPRTYDTWLYRERHLVECFMNKIKHFRHLFSRFDKLDRSFFGFLYFVGALLWLR